MIIKDIFKKSIDRDLKGVIKADQTSNDDIKQELDEYVVTKELQKHFSSLFSNYKKGIIGNTDKMGVWISGFFGSGKSHFLKIISYILENKIIDDMSAVEYFEKGKKIEDGIVLANMELAAKTPSTVILFNIDSKSESSGNKGKDSILSVFLKAFNDKLGYCGAYPHVADLERRLSSENKYESFKEKFFELHGQDWLEERYDIAFIQDEIVETLTAIDFMSEEAARNWCKEITEPYRYSKERFGELVKSYLESQGNNHHIIFLVDEVGQYIGENSDLMLDLQTVTEDLGTSCKGKAWIMVTSQEDIDSVLKVKGGDFSKIQGRFDTRLSLSSADVAEVIKKRILDKNETGKSSLSMLYDEKATVIKNLILFNDEAEKKLYSGKEDFAETYPFVSYQFNLLGSVLTAIRTYGASGKHLADGERSMLALFKESAARIKNKNLGAIVPFYMFYDALEQFIDHSHRGVITKALDNEKLNPEHLFEECFDVNILKVLLMIKYVKEIQSTVENITSLMVSDINADRINLQEKVEDALERLVKQTLVQKSGHNYVFLTNEEQEINRAIESQSIGQDQVISKVSELIFEDLYGDNKYHAPKPHDRYYYGVNKFVDNRPYKINQNYQLTLKILTPYSDEVADEAAMRMKFGQDRNCIFVVFPPNDSLFMEEISISIKIDKYLSTATETAEKYEQIKNDKQKERREHNDQARVFLAEALRMADIYVNGNKIQSNTKDITSRIDEAMNKLISNVYHKLNYITKPSNEGDIREIFRDNGQQLTLDSSTNELALRDVKDYIDRNSVKHTRVSMKFVMDNFLKPPYGFMAVDVQWLVAKLFKDAEIAFYVNNDAVSLANKNSEDIIRYITRKEYLEKLMIEKREKINENQKKSVRNVMKDLFSDFIVSSDDDDIIMKNFIDGAKKLENNLKEFKMKYDNQPRYPGSKTIQSGKSLLNEVLDIKYANEFFSFVHSKHDDFLNFAEDYRPIKKFFEGKQKNIWDEAIKLKDIYTKSKTYIIGSEIENEVENIIKNIDKILNQESPFSHIFELPGLRDKFYKSYNNLLERNQIPILKSIEEARKRVFDELKGKHCKDKLSKKYENLFEEIKNKAEHCNNIADLQGISHEANRLRLNLLKEIEKEETAQNNNEFNSTNIQVSAPKAKKYKSIKDINSLPTWEIKNKEDINRYLSELERKLNDLLEDGVVLQIEF